MSESQPVSTLQPPGVHWRLFIRALAEEVDSRARPAERDDLLRAIGHRMARMTPLPAVDWLDALQAEMNEALQAMGWGQVLLQLVPGERAVIIQHTGLPKIGSLGQPVGAWLSALLEGLYEGWFAQQPGSQAALVARRVPSGAADAVTLRFARAPELGSAALPA